MAPRLQPKKGAAPAPQHWSKVSLNTVKYNCSLAVGSLFTDVSTAVQWRTVHIHKHMTVYSSRWCTAYVVVKFRYTLWVIVGGMGGGGGISVSVKKF